LAVDAVGQLVDGAAAAKWRDEHKQTSQNNADLSDFFHVAIPRSSQKNESERSAGWTDAKRQSSAARESEARAAVDDEFRAAIAESSRRRSATPGSRTPGPVLTHQKFHCITIAPRWCRGPIAPKPRPTLSFTPSMKSRRGRA